MKYLILSAITIALLFTTSVRAASNNGYTSAANVYTQASSTTWYGGGVQHVLAEWRKQADQPEQGAVAAEELAPAENAATDEVAAEPAMTSKSAESASEQTPAAED